MYLPDFEDNQTYSRRGRQQAASISAFQARAPRSIQKAIKKNVAHDDHQSGAKRVHD